MNAVFKLIDPAEMSLPFHSGWMFYFFDGVYECDIRDAYTMYTAGGEL